MRNVHATWEQRHLGLDVYEWFIESTDDRTTLKNALQNQPMGDYTFCMVPVGRYDLMEELQHNNFMFVEVRIGFRSEVDVLLKKIERFKAFVDRFHLEEVTDESQFAEVAAKFAHPLFTTDRIAFDPFLGVEKANRRYLNWMADKFRDKKTNVVQVKDRKENAIGFFAVDLQENSDEAYGFLAGVYPEYQQSGLGVVIFAKMIEWATGHGARVLLGATSSNNTDSVHMHTTLGYQVQEMMYVYKRINNR
jgi:GNAT superfamily N-acetyltransferase